MHTIIHGLPMLPDHHGGYEWHVAGLSVTARDVGGQWIVWISDVDLAARTHVSAHAIDSDAGAALCEALVRFVGAASPILGERVVRAIVAAQVAHAETEVAA